MTELSTLKMFKAAGPNGKDMMTVCPLARPLAAPYQEGLQCILQEKKKYLKSEKTAMLVGIHMGGFRHMSEGYTSISLTCLKWKCI